MVDCGPVKPPQNICCGSDGEHRQLCPVTRDTRTCGRCLKPAYLHCPDCLACWPDFSCLPECSGDDPERPEIIEKIDEWQEANQS